MMPRGWEPLAGDTRGTVTALAVATPHALYATTAVGVYQSEDSGATWSLSGRSASVPFGEAVAAVDGAVFVGAADGLHRSIDDGQTWQPALVGSRVTAVCAAAGFIVAGTHTDGVLRSEDGGHSWSGANAGLLDLEVLAVGLSPDFASDGTGFVGTGSGLFRTRNRAESWRIVDTGLDEAALQCVAVGPDRLVVVGTEAHGVVCSHDAGTTWERPADLDGRSVTAIAISQRGTVAAATDAGLFVSRDRGQCWHFHTTTPSGILSLLYLDSNLLLAAAERTGVWRSTDDGASWTDSSNGLHAALLSTLAVSADESVWVAGPTEGVRLWRNGLWQARDTGLADSTVLGLSTASDGSVFAATPHGLYSAHTASPRWRLTLSAPVRAVSASSRIIAVSDRIVASDDLGSTWRTVDTPFRASEVVALAAEGPTLLAGTREEAETVLWRSVDDGHQWDRLFVHPRQLGILPIAVSPETIFIGIDNEVVRPGHHHTPSFEGTVTSIAANGRTVWVGTSSGVYVSRDSGETYQPSASSGPRRVIALAAAADVVYALELGGCVWLSRPAGR